MVFSMPIIQLPDAFNRTKLYPICVNYRIAKRRFSITRINKLSNYYFTESLAMFNHVSYVELRDVMMSEHRRYFIFILCKRADMSVLLDCFNHFDIEYRGYVFLIYSSSLTLYSILVIYLVFLKQEKECSYESIFLIHFVRKCLGNLLISMRQTSDFLEFSVVLEIGT